MKWNHRDHRAQLLALHRSTRKSDDVVESVVQMPASLLSLFQCLTTLLLKNIFLISSLTPPVAAWHHFLGSYYWPLRRIDWCLPFHYTSWGNHCYHLTLKNDPSPQIVHFFFFDNSSLKKLTTYFERNYDNYFFLNSDNYFFNSTPGYLL